MVVETTAVAVGLGEYQVSRDPGDVLVAYGLGSCVGIAVYDPIARVAGLLHAVLPQRPPEADPCSAKYVDSGLAQLLAEMGAAGALRRRLVIRMAGGANMLTVRDLQRVFSIGERNVTAAQAAFAAGGLTCQAQEVGGQTGRTLRVYVADGRMTVRVIGQQERDF
jgi:chemotaxis protein CheD